MIRKIFAPVALLLVLVSVNVHATSIKVTDDEPTATKKVIDPKNTLYIELKDGIVIAELFPDKAPMHVQRIRTLTQDGFYDGLKFHRVIAGFMAQTGDPTGTGRGGSNLGRLYAEFNDEHHTRGTLSMARASDPNSANSQFFIVTGDFFPELDGQYTVFGRVVEGMEYVDKIKVGNTANNGAVDNPDIMVKVAMGEMLNNKSTDTIKQEIAVVNQMQAEKKKEDPAYKNQSVLALLLGAKDVDSNEVEQPATPTAVETPAMPTQPNNPTPPTGNSVPPTVPAPVPPSLPNPNANTAPSIQNAQPVGNGTKTKEQIEKEVIQQMGNTVKDEINQF